MKPVRTAALAFITALAAGSAFAQSTTVQPTDDWDMTRDPSKKLVLAHVGLTSGLMIATRCMDGRFDVLLAGLPPAPGRDLTRPLALGWDGEVGGPSTWNITTDRSVVLASFPAAAARRLRLGGRLQVSIPNGASDGRTLRHDVELPLSSAAIEETLTACGKPLVDPRDAFLPDVPASGLSAPARWARPPRPSYPSSSRYASGYAVATCLTQPDGKLGDCVIESEHPSDGRFGEATLSATRRAEVTIDGEEKGRYTPRMISFRTNFMMRP